MILRRLKKILGTIPTAVVMAFIMLPVVLVVWMSFFDQKIITFPPKGYTIEWYTVLAEKSTFCIAEFGSGPDFQCAGNSVGMSCVHRIKTKILSRKEPYGNYVFGTADGSNYCERNCNLCISYRNGE